MSDLIVEISKLSIAHRVELVQAILNTIISETSDAITLTPIQAAIIESRAAEVADGSVKTIPWEDIQVNLVKRYGLQN
jgi:putative addiction module component (TIGR02574 family)